MTRIPVTLYRRCPNKSLIWILSGLERPWPWPIHEYVLGVKRELIGLDQDQVQTVGVAPRTAAEGL